MVIFIKLCYALINTSGMNQTKFSFAAALLVVNFLLDISYVSHEIFTFYLNFFTFYLKSFTFYLKSLGYTWNFLRFSWNFYILPELFSFLPEIFTFYLNIFFNVSLYFNYDTVLLWNTLYWHSLEYISSTNYKYWTYVSLFTKFIVCINIIELIWITYGIWVLIHIPYNTSIGGQSLIEIKITAQDASEA